jgi:hypothetical protein
VVLVVVVQLAVVAAVEAAAVALAAAKAAAWPHTPCWWISAWVGAGQLRGQLSQ